MAETIVELLTDVADAIREKKGSNEPINAQRFAEEIRSIEGGGGSGSNELLDSILTRTITTLDYSIKGIGAHAFDDSRQLVSVRLPDTISISTGAFYNCEHLVDFYAPNWWSTSAQIFYGCVALEQIELPKVTTLSSNMFRNCTKLKRVDCGAVTNVATNAFLSCSVFDTLIIRTASLCTLAATTAFSSTPFASGGGTIYVPDDLVDSYKSETNWSTYADRIKGLSELPNE